jgi:GntR family transcriptional repressor for pyruvate dehydrogenase complex
VKSTNGDERGPASSAVARPPKAAVLVAHALAERIADLEPGAMLPPERELLTELEVGRGTLREALRLLELQGLVSVKAGPRGGPVVLKPDHKPLANALSLFLQSAEAPFLEVVQARRAIEADLARLAAQHAGIEDVAELRASIVAMSDRLGDEDFFLAENLRFHRLCAKAARNEVLEVFHSCLKSISDGHAVGVSYTPRHRAAILVWHNRITDAIEANDPDASYSAMNDHMREFEEYIRRRYPTVLKRRVRWRL